MAKIIVQTMNYYEKKLLIYKIFKKTNPFTTTSNQEKLGKIKILSHI